MAKVTNKNYVLVDYIGGVMCAYNATLNSYVPYNKGNGNFTRYTKPQLNKALSNIKVTSTAEILHVPTDTFYTADGLWQ